MEETESKDEGGNRNWEMVEYADILDFLAKRPINSASSKRMTQPEYPMTLKRWDMKAK